MQVSARLRKGGLLMAIGLCYYVHTCSGTCSHFVFFVSRFCSALLCCVYESVEDQASEV